MNKTRFIVLLIMFYCAAVAGLNAEIAIEAIDYGLYEIDEQGATLSKITNSIPAKKGVQFGARYIFSFFSSKNEAESITVKTIFPMMKNGEKVFYISEYLKEIYSGKVVLIGYTLEEESELVPGTWTFQILYNGKSIDEKKFTVVNSD